MALGRRPLPVGLAAGRLRERARRHSEPWGSGGWPRVEALGWPPGKPVLQPSEHRLHRECEVPHVFVAMAGEHFEDHPWEPLHDLPAVTGQAGRSVQEV